MIIYSLWLLEPTWSQSDNGNDKRQEEIVHVGLGGVSIKFVWENIDSFPASRETFCSVYGPQFNTSELDVMSAFENIFHIALVQLIVDETNRYAQQEISKSMRPHTFCSRIWKWEDVMVYEMYMVLALFMLIGIIQKPTLRSFYTKNPLLFTPICSKTLPLERLTYLRSWALLEELSIVQPFKTPPAFYGTRRFNTMFTRALHWSLSWAISIQSIPSYLSKIHFNIVHPPTSWSS
jgi:hypothetical protein